MLNRIARAAEESLLHEEEAVEREDRDVAAAAATTVKGVGEGVTFNPCLGKGLERFCSTSVLRLRHARGARQLREHRASAPPGDFASLAGPEAMRAEREAKAGLDPLLFASLLKGCAPPPLEREEGTDVAGWPPRPATSSTEFHRLLVDGRALLDELKREDEEEEKEEEEEEEEKDKEKEKEKEEWATATGREGEFVDRGR